MEKEILELKTPDNSKENTEFNYNHVVKENAHPVVDHEQNKSTNENEEASWFFITKSEGAWNGHVYKIDSHGNLIAKLNVDNMRSKVIEQGENITDEIDETKVFEAIKRTKRQIDFIHQQEKLKEEIKGYPEFNEEVFQLYEHDNTLIRFKKEVNLLRALFDPTTINQLRILLSICSYYDMDCLNGLISDGIIVPQYLNSTELKVFNILTQHYKLHNKLPPLQLVINCLKLPYSKDFFEEYLLKDDDFDQAIAMRYDIKRKNGYNLLAEKLPDYKGTGDNLIASLVKFETACTPFNISDTYNELQNNLELRKQEIKISTGIKALDDENVFLKKGQIGTVFAYTGGFKTMFCTNVAYNTIKNGGNVLYVSLEISKDDMYINFLSRHSYNFDRKISHSDVKAARLTEEENKYLFEVIYPDFKTSLKSHLIVYDETDIKSNTYAGFSKLLVRADKDFTKKTNKGIDLIIIDHLNLFKFRTEEKTMNDYAAVNHWMSYFRKHCINFLNQKKKVAILCACQSSREGYKNAIKEGGYQLTGIAEGNEIERSSQLVLSIFNDDEMREQNEVLMQILKMRDEAHSESKFMIKLEPKYYTFESNGKKIGPIEKDDIYDDEDDEESDTSVFDD